MFEQFSISKIINSVGNSSGKRLTLIIILIFMILYIATQSYFERSDCSDLIKQNEQVLKNNFTLSKLNSSLLVDNAILITKIDSINKSKLDVKTVTKILEKLVIKNDTIFIQRNDDFISLNNLNRIETSRSFDFYTEDSTDYGFDSISK